MNTSEGAPPLQVPVTRRALIQRISRKLAKRRQLLRANRSPRNQKYFGDWYVIDVELNAVTKRHVDLVRFGAKLGVLQPSEFLNN